MNYQSKKLCRPITLSEFEIDPDEWRKLTEENAMTGADARRGKKIAGKDSFYDAEIIKNITGEWQKIRGY